MKVSQIKEGQLVAVRGVQPSTVQCAMAFVFRPVKDKKTVQVGIAIKEPLAVKGGVPGGSQHWSPAWVYPNQIIDTWDNYDKKQRDKEEQERRARDAVLQAQTRFQSILDTLKKRGVISGVYVDRRNKRVSGVALDFDAAEKVLQLLSMLPPQIKWGEDVQW